MVKVGNYFKTRDKTMRYVKNTFKILLLLFIVYLLADYFRYVIVSSGDGAYKFDRISGQVYYMRGPYKAIVREKKFK